MSRLGKVALALTGLIGLLLAAGVIALRVSGAWGVFFPSTDFDTQAPEIPVDFGSALRPGDPPPIRVLIFSKTNAYRHREGIASAQLLFERLAPHKGWALYASENGALFEARQLARFDVVVFSNATGNMLSDEQDLAFQHWLEAGGGWVGIHSAGDSSHEDWDWYQDTLIGVRFIGHILGPQFQSARVVVEDRTHPLTQGLPEHFQHTEEWYSWDASARTRGMNVLLRVEESSYEPYLRILGSETDLRMQDHPIAWWRCVGRGRAVYSAMGHQGAAFQSQPHVRLLENAIDWAAGRGADECPVEAR